MATQFCLFGEEDLNTTEEKQCDECFKYLCITKFDKDPYRSDGLDHRCKECKADTRRKQKYGLEGNSYGIMLRNQEYRCRICRIHQDELRNKKFDVDHDHKSGKVRGLLCPKCNKGLGCFLDSPINMRVGADYIEESWEN